MIAFNPATRMFTGHFGEKVSFDTNQLKVEIIEAFFLSGYPQEAWLADEIINGVEFAISQLSKVDQESLTLNNLSELVAQMLEQTDHHIVAETYLQLQFPVHDEKPGSKAYIFGTLTEYFEDWMPTVLADLTDDVYNMLALTGITAPSKTFIYELALNLSKRKAIAPQVHLPEVHLAEKPKIVLTSAAFISLLSHKQKHFFNTKIIDIHPIGNVFPSLHLRIDWIALINDRLPNQVVNEFSFYPILHQLAEMISNIAQKVKTHLNLHSLPISIEMIHTKAFVIDKLSATWADKGKHLAEDFLNELASNIHPEPFKLLMF